MEEGGQQLWRQLGYKVKPCISPNPKPWRKLTAEGHTKWEIVPTFRIKPDKPYNKTIQKIKKQSERRMEWVPSKKPWEGFRVTAELAFPGRTTADHDGKRKVEECPSTEENTEPFKRTCWVHTYKWGWGKRRQKIGLRGWELDSTRIWRQAKEAPEWHRQTNLSFFVFVMRRC